MHIGNITEFQQGTASSTQDNAQDKPHRPDEAFEDTDLQSATSLDAQIQGMDQQADERRYPP